MDLDRQKLIKTVGDALGVDLLKLRAFELTLGKRPGGQLSLKLHLFDETPDLTKRIAEDLTSRYALPAAPMVPPSAAMGPTPPAAPVPAVAPLAPPPTAVYSPPALQVISHVQDGSQPRSL